MPWYSISHWFQNTSQSSSEEETQDEARLWSTSGPNGLATLADPSGATVDIIFVHGLTGNRLNTWKHKENKRVWPRDFLPNNVPCARIATWGYDADVAHFGISIAGSNTVRDHGKNLATDIGNWRIFTRTPIQRRIIFVAHSLGGLVVEQALQISNGASREALSLRTIIDSTYGITFMGTPHMGSEVANWASQLGRLNDLINGNRKIIATLEPASEVLANLQQEFHTLVETRRTDEGKRLRLYCFYEESATRVLGRKIVPDHSAILPQAPNNSIPGTHTSMTKYADANDVGYVRVSSQLLEWTAQMQPEQGKAPPHQHTKDPGNSRKGQSQRVIEYHSTRFNSEGGPMFNDGTFQTYGDLNISGRGR